MFYIERGNGFPSELKREKRMTKSEAVKTFRAEWAMMVRGNPQLKTDVVAHNETWGNYIDSLCKCGEITVRQYENWDNPPMPKRYPKEIQY